VLGKRDLHHETKEGIDLLFKPVFLGEFVREKRKPNFGNVIGQRKNSPRKVGSVPTLLLVASREQIRPVENVILVIAILLPVKYLLNQWFP
jgi:hypothetical protein